MKDFKTKSKIKKVVVQPFFCFEFDHMPSDQKIREEIQNFMDNNNIAYSVKVSYQQKYKGNFYDHETKKLYKWNDLMELRNEKS
jgi:alpha-acetolactate decarboxylase|tara:strand:- start:271 stop:522 length:252 start_codon:yes stop_codon:yes gene_type:complete